MGTLLFIYIYIFIYFKKGMSTLLVYNISPKKRKKKKEKKISVFGNGGANHPRLTFKKKKKNLIDKLECHLS